MVSIWKCIYMQLIASWQMQAGAYNYSGQSGFHLVSLPAPPHTALGALPAPPHAALGPFHTQHWVPSTRSTGCIASPSTCSTRCIASPYMCSTGCIHKHACLLNSFLPRYCGCASPTLILLHVTEWGNLIGTQACRHHKQLMLKTPDHFSSFPPRPQRRKAGLATPDYRLTLLFFLLSSIKETYFFQ